MTTTNILIALFSGLGALAFLLLAVKIALPKKRRATPPAPTSATTRTTPSNTAPTATPGATVQDPLSQMLLLNPIFDAAPAAKTASGTTSDRRQADDVATEKKHPIPDTAYDSPSYGGSSYGDSSYGGSSYGGDSGSSSSSFSSD